MRWNRSSAPPSLAEADSCSGRGEPCATGTMIVPQHLVAQLDRCTVQVHGEDGFAGSGVFAAPGVVLTCAHVVIAAESACSIVWQERLLPPPVSRSCFPSQETTPMIRIHFPIWQCSGWLIRPAIHVPGWVQKVRPSVLRFMLRVSARDTLTGDGA